MDSASRVVVYPALSDTPSTVTAGTFIVDAGGATSDQLSAVNAALSNRITSVAGMAGGGSVTSAELQAVSAAAASGIATVSNALSVEIANRISAVNVVSQAVSALSQTNSANHVSINSRIDTVSNAVSALSQTNSANHASINSRIDTVSNAVSALSQTNSVEHAALSNRITSVAGLAGGGSVTSAEVAALSAALQSAINTVSQAVSVETAGRISADNALSVRIDTVSNAVSVLSQAVSVADAALSNRITSVAAAGGGPQIRIVSNTQSTAGSALVDISGLVLTVAADQTWEVQLMLAMSTSATTVGLRMGYSVPPLSTPRFGQITRYSGGQSAGIAGAAGLLQVSGNSIFMSMTGVGPAGGVFVIQAQHVMNIASAGTIRPMYAGIASTAASPIHILPGSYLKAIRLK